MMKTYSLIVLCAVLTLAGCRKDKDDESAIVFQASGNIDDDIDAFRALLGPLNTGAATVAGRREINWDGVPDDQLGKPLPEDFFNPTGPGALAARQRGLMYTSLAGTFMVSKSNFSEINTLAAGSFRPFSGNNTFANTSRNLWEVGFRVPGATTRAAVTGFGAVFSDVDVPNSSFLELFEDDKSLGRYAIPAHDNTSSHSFLGVYFKEQHKITRVVVSHPGTLAAGNADVSNGGTDDLIILDDFFYGEPTKQP
jgi:hypothetical protein